MSADSRPWRAERVVTPEHVRSCLARAKGTALHKDAGAGLDNLAASSLREPRLIAEGWDNFVFESGELLVRIPRRAIALPGIRREILVLPFLASLLPTRVPAPVVWSGIGDDVGEGGRRETPMPTQASLEPEWPWFAYRPVPGRELAQASADGTLCADAARELGRVLRLLHDAKLPSQLESLVPNDPMRRGDVPLRIERAREALHRLVSAGALMSIEGLEGCLREAESVGVLAGESLIHGDLHFRHILVGESGALAGLIDWGDLCQGPPMIDLHIWWSYLEGDARSAFEESYGRPSREVLLGARVLAIMLHALVALSARDCGTPEVERGALAVLRRIEST